MRDRREFLTSLAVAGVASLGAAELNAEQTGTGKPHSAGTHAGSTGHEAVFNVKDYGASGIKTENATVAIQEAIDACAAAGGGVVYLPPGEYTSGGLKLRSHVRMYLESGTTLFASTDPHAYPLIDVQTWGQSDANSTAALFQGDNLEDISIEGSGTVDGQASFIWTQDTTERAFINKNLMEKMGKSLMRTYPVGFPNRQIYPHLVWLHRCKDVRIADLSFLRSPSWTFYLFECDRVVMDGVYASTSLKEAVWCDGIDINGCTDVHISNSTIETGDDCIAIFSSDRPCENVTITNCRFSSASAGIKFTEGVKVAARKVVIDNCVITNCNRGITLQIESGGTIEDVIISNLTMYMNRFDWFWAGHGNAFNFEIKTPSEWNQEPPKPGDPGPGLIRNVTIQNIIAHAKGTSTVAGHQDPAHWLENVTFENIKLFLSTDPNAPYDTSVNALNFQYARNLKVKDVEVFWETPTLDRWKSAISFENIDGLELNGFAGRQAWPEQDTPTVVLDTVANALVVNSRATEGTNVFLGVTGEGSKQIGLLSNDFRQAKVPYKLSDGAQSSELQAMSNLLPPG